MNTVLLAEALRYHRHGRALLLDDGYAKSKALEQRGTDEQRLLCWVSNAAATEGIHAALDAVTRAAVYAVVIIVVVAAVAGAGAAAAVLNTGAGRVVEIPFALLSLTGLQFLLLVLWVVFGVWALAKRRFSTSTVAPTRFVGSLVLWIAGLLSRVVHAPASSREDRRAAVLALSYWLSRNAVGWWLFSAVTHLAWLAFTVAALLVAWVRLIAVQYDFVWSTTILSTEAAVSSLLAAAWLPGLLGFVVPDAQLIEATRLGSEAPGSGRDVWAAFLLGGLVAYGVLPRFALAVICGLSARRLAARLRLDQGHVIFQEALIALDRARSSDTPLGSAPADVLNRPGSVQPPMSFGPGAFFVLLGVELDEPDAWPPECGHWSCLPLGHIATRADAKRALSELQRLTEVPRFVAVVVSMVRTPDRGAMDLLSDITVAGRAPVMLILAESARLRERGFDVEQRVREWRERAERVGIGAVIVADWDEQAGLRQAALEDSLRLTGVT